MSTKVVSLMAVEMAVLEGIARRLIYDDANLTGPQKEAAQKLYITGLINACPLEGSDAAVETLWLTDEGEDVLIAAGMMPARPKLDVNDPIINPVLVFIRIIEFDTDILRMKADLLQRMTPTEV